MVLASYCSFNSKCSWLDSGASLDSETGNHIIFFIFQSPKDGIHGTVVSAVSGFMISLSVLLSFSTCPLHICSECLHSPFFFPSLLSCSSFSILLDAFLQSRARQQKEGKEEGSTNERNILSQHCCDLPRTFVRTEHLKMCQTDVEMGLGSKDRCISSEQGEPRR